MSDTSMITIADFPVGRVGLGTMPLTGPGAMGEPDDPANSERLLRHAVETGVRLIDTSGYYGPGVANRLIRQALAPYPADLLIATKVGARRTPDGGFAADSAPDAVRSAVRENLRQLGLETLDLVHARFMPDSEVPFDETVGTLEELRNEGLLRHVGVSNVDVAQLDRIAASVPLASVENEFRLDRTAGRDVLERTAELGIAYLAFRPLGNGALLRSPKLRALAERAEVPPATLALAWILRQHEQVAVIPGSSSPEHLTENLRAETLLLDDDLVDALNNLDGEEA